mmetsp:Transcript_53669/g.138737  ORF Transcript_53669/g.138737 Transcript_53669/m.138737 type:complete len:200 (+) Transcript_53669:560-1159(+)
MLTDVGQHLRRIAHRARGHTRPVAWTRLHPCLLRRVEARATGIIGSTHTWHLLLLLNHHHLLHLEVAVAHPAVDHATSHRIATPAAAAATAPSTAALTGVALAAAGGVGPAYDERLGGVREFLLPMDGRDRFLRHLLRGEADKRARHAAAAPSFHYEHFLDDPVLSKELPELLLVTPGWAAAHEELVFCVGFHPNSCHL